MPKVPGYVPNFEPYAHQKKATKKLRRIISYALLMAMRTGKTKIIIDNFGEMEAAEEVDDLLVIAPAGVYKVWPAEFITHADPRLIRRIKSHLWEASAKRDDLKWETRFLELTSGPRVMYVDIEALSSVERARKACLAFLQSGRRSMIALDEATTVKQPDSERSRFVCDKLRKLATYRRILTGLVAPNSPLDVWSQFYFLDPQILGTSYTDHKAKYADIEQVCMLPNELLIAKLEAKLGINKLDIPGVGRVRARDLGRQHILQIMDDNGIWVQKVPITKRFKNEELLAKAIAPHSFRVRLDQCYDMPEKVYVKRTVKLTKDQVRIYAELRLRALAELEAEKTVTANMVITRLLRLHQVLCGHVKDDDGNLHEIKENRVAEVMSVLAEYDGKAIIWTAYDYSVRQLDAAIKKVYGPDSVSRFWGGNIATREAEEKRFKNEPACRFQIATQSAGGRGRNWSIANLMIYHASQNNLEHRSQSEERGEAVGKLQPMAVVDLVAEGTVDEHIIAALRKKINMATTIMGDDYKKWII